MLCITNSAYSLLVLPFPSPVLLHYSASQILWNQLGSICCPNTYRVLRETEVAQIMQKIDLQVMSLSAAKERIKVKGNLIPELHDNLNCTVPLGWCPREEP